MQFILCGTVVAITLVVLKPIRVEETGSSLLSFLHHSGNQALLDKNNSLSSVGSHTHTYHTDQLEW